MGVVRPGNRNTIVDLGSGGLGLRFYHYRDNGEYAQWLKKYPGLEFDILATFHHPCFNDERLSSSSEHYSLLDPCEIPIKEEWILRGLTHWVDCEDENKVNLIHVDGMQDEEAIIEASKLEEPLYFKTTSMGIVVGHDVKDYPNVPADWYKNKDEQTHVTEVDLKYVDITNKNGKVRQMKMGTKLDEKEIKEYAELVDEFSDTFAWLYDELKGIPREMVEHRIPLISGARLIRQKNRRMNPQLQLLVKAELERLLKAGGDYGLGLSDGFGEEQK